MNRGVSELLKGWLCGGWKCSFVEDRGYCIVAQKHELDFRVLKEVENYVINIFTSDEIENNYVLRDPHAASYEFYEWCIFRYNTTTINLSGV